MSPFWHACLWIVVIICFGGTVWWLRKIDPSGEDQASATVKAHLPKKITRHEELLQARAKIIRQIEILETPAGGPAYQTAPPRTDNEQAVLRDMLSKIDRELRSERD